MFDAPGNIGGGRKDEVAFNFALPTDKLGVPRGQFTGLATWRWSSVTDPTTGLKREISVLHPTDAEIRTLHTGRGLYMRIRRTFG